MATFTRIYYIMFLGSITVLIQNVNGQEIVDGNQLKSSAINFITFSEYEKTYILYQRIKMYKELSEKIETEIDSSWPEHIANTDIKKHFIFVKILSKYSTSLTEILVAINTKILAFVNGISYLNCVLCTSHITFTGVNIKNPTCSTMADDLLQFSLSGIEDLLVGLNRLLKNVPRSADIFNSIKELFTSMESFIDKFLYSKEVVLSESFNEKQEEIERYDWICDEEFNDIGQQLMTVNELFEFIKFGDNQRHLRYEDPIWLSFNEAKTMWDLTDDVDDLSLGSNNDELITNLIRESEARKLQSSLHGPFALSNEDIDRLKNVEVDMFQILILGTESSDNCFVNTVNLDFYNIINDKYINIRNFRTEIDKVTLGRFPYFH